jgi:hypothetical protein
MQGRLGVLVALFGEQYIHMDTYNEYNLAGVYVYKYVICVRVVYACAHMCMYACICACMRVYVRVCALVYVRDWLCA